MFMAILDIQIVSASWGA